MKTLNEDIQKAIDYAVRLHDKQRRKGGDVPYVQHPISIAMMMLELDLNTNIIVTALLHDSIEDTSMTYEELRREFGATVESYVRGCTEPDQTIKWELRKQRTIDKFKFQNRDVKWVILGDKLHNIYSIYQHYLQHGNDTWNHFSRGFEKQKWYYRSLRDLFKEEEQFKDTQLLKSYCQLYTSLFEG